MNESFSTRMSCFLRFVSGSWEKTRVKTVKFLILGAQYSYWANMTHIPLLYWENNPGWGFLWHSIGLINTIRWGMLKSWSIVDSRQVSAPPVGHSHLGRQNVGRLTSLPHTITIVGAGMKGSTESLLQGWESIVWDAGKPELARDSRACYEARQWGSQTLKLSGAAGSQEQRIESVFHTLGRVSSLEPWGKGSSSLP